MNTICKRLETELTRRPALHRSAITDADVVREIAEIWVDSGGDAGGFDRHYIDRIRAEIDRLREWRGTI